MKATGTLDTHLLAGSYTIDFGLGGSTYQLELELEGPVALTEDALRAGPSCERPTFRFYE